MVKRSFTRRTGIIAALIFAVLAWQGPAWADNPGSNSAGGGKLAPGPFEFELDGGLKVEFRELRESRDTYYFNIEFTVTPPDDMMFKIAKDKCVAYDDRGNEYTYVALWIGNKETTERFIIAGVPTSFGFLFIKGMTPSCKHLRPHRRQYNGQGDYASQRTCHQVARENGGHT